jgi:DNA repair ATPase RecN
MVICKRKISPLVWVSILLAFCALAWAVAELSGMANKSAADSGLASADLEMSSLETIQKPTKNPPPVDWKQEQQLRKELAKLDAEYKSVAVTAQSQASQGIDDSIRTALLAAAEKFKATSDRYADVWEKGKCITRARLARETGASRMASAELIIAGADSNKIEALNTQQDKLNEARKAYIEEAKVNQELSAEDKTALKSNLMPRAQKLVSDTAGLVTQVADLLNQIQQQASPSALVGGVSSCATTGGKSADDSVSRLLSPVTGLLSLVRGLAGNAQSLVSDITSLAE